jgi:hypothetical protein
MSSQKHIPCNYCKLKKSLAKEFVVCGHYSEPKKIEIPISCAAQNLTDEGWRLSIGTDGKVKKR